MFEMADFCEYCDRNDVDVISKDDLPSPSITVRDGDYYAVGINLNYVDTNRLLRTIALHEMGHLRTGALHKVSSPFQIIAQAEYRANANSFRASLTPEVLRAAMHKGYRESWQLADYFDLEQDYIEKALHYWKDCIGIAL